MTHKDKVQLTIIWGAVFIVGLGMWLGLRIYTSVPARNETRLTKSERL